MKINIHSQSVDRNAEEVILATRQAAEATEANVIRKHEKCRWKEVSALAEADSRRS